MRQPAALARYPGLPDVDRLPNMRDTLGMLLRPALPSDVDAIARVWHDAWGDGHTGNVPDALLPYRSLEHFVERVPQRIANTTVAVQAGRVVGFVTLHDDELEQIFVAREARGSGVASRLIQHAEAAIAQRFETAWLAVVAGNDRALRFYEREGWHDAGAIAYAAEIPGGALPIPTRRYEKRVRA